MFEILFPGVHGLDLGVVRKLGFLIAVLKTGWVEVLLNFANRETLRLSDLEHRLLGNEEV